MLRTYPGHTTSTHTAVAFSPDGKLLAYVARQSGGAHHSAPRNADMVRTEEAPVKRLAPNRRPAAVEIFQGDCALSIPSTQSKKAMSSGVERFSLYSKVAQKIAGIQSA